MSTAIRPAARSVVMAAVRPRSISSASHVAGATLASKSADAFTPPIANITSANNAGSRHPPLRTDRMVSPTSQGRPAHGSRISEMRAVKASWYGVSM